MRDPKRIDRMISIVEYIWKKNPDWRLPQLIMNALAISGDPYYIEDDDLEKALNDLKANYESSSNKRQ